MLLIQNIQNTVISGLLSSDSKAVSQASTCDAEYKDTLKYSDHISAYNEFVSNNKTCSQAAEIHFKLAQEYEKVGQPAEAVKAYDLIVKHYPTSDFAKQSLAILIKRAVENNEPVALTAARINLFKKHFPKAVNELMGSVVRSLAERNKSDEVGFDAEKDELFKTLKMKPSPEITLEIGKIYEDFYHDIDSTLLIYQGLSKAPIKGMAAEEALMRIGAVYEYKLHNYEEATRIYQQELDSYPAPPFYVHGNETTGRYTLLKETNSQLSSYRRDSLNNHLAKIYFQKLNMYDAALKIYQKLLDQTRMGEILEKQGKMLQAAAHYEKGADVNSLLRAAVLLLRYGNNGGENIEKAKKILGIKGRFSANGDDTTVKELLEILDTPNIDQKIRSGEVEGLTYLYFQGTDAWLFYNKESVVLFHGNINLIHTYSFTGGAVTDNPGPALKWTHNNGTETILQNPLKHLHRQREVSALFNLLPKGFFAGLRNIYISGTVPAKWGDDRCGEYFEEYKTFVLYGYLDQADGEYKNRDCRNVSLHELMHHWDLRVSHNNEVYYSISWTKNNSKYQLIGTAEEFIGQTVGDKHPMKNQKEDFASAGTAYLVDAKSMRQKARDNIKQMNFGLAAKYLYIKYLTPFAGKEFDVSPQSRGIDFDEVESALKANKANVRKSTLAALNKIKAEAIKIGLIKDHRGLWGCSAKIGAR